MENQMQNAEQAWASVDRVSFDASMGGAALALRCLDEPVEVSTARRWHLLRALEHFTAGDEEAAAASLQAYVDLGGTTPDPSLIPPGSPVAELLSQTVPGSPSTPVDAKELHWVDGRPGADRPLERPAVVQVHNAESAWLNVELQPNDAWPAFAEPVPVVQVNRPILAGGVGTLAAAGGLLGLAAWQHSAYENEQTSAKAIRNHAIAADALLVGSGLAVLGGSAMVVVAF